MASLSNAHHFTGTIRDPNGQVDNEEPSIHREEINRNFFSALNISSRLGTFSAYVRRFEAELSQFLQEYSARVAIRIDPEAIQESIFKFCDDLLDGLFRENLLAGTALSGLHSVERLPLPRCHPGTRVHLLTEVDRWLTDEEREHGMMWLFGPAGVGKSAVAQTIGERAEDLGLFGGAIFFSKGRKVHDPSLFIGSIAYQLTRQNPPYQRLVMKVISKDPTVLTSLDKKGQFQELILKPFSSLKLNGRKKFSKLLIVIDGLDECQGEEAQLDLVRLITESAKSPDSPFLWMICSRPEHHLKDFFRNNDISTLCVARDLLPSEPGVDVDVKKFLVDRLADLMKRSQGSNARLSVLGDSEVVKKLVDFVSGIFVVASSMLTFIGDNKADPASRLQIVLSIIDGSVTDPGVDNFLTPIDRLYTGVLGNVETDWRPTTLRLLGTCAVSPRIPALQLANLLNITQGDFYNALRPLHAFISVPHHTIANEESLHFFHASFPDFLSHHHRSQDYYQDPVVHRLALAETCFEILNSTVLAYSQGLSWLPPDSVLDDDEDEDDAAPSALSISYDISTFAATHFWEICMQTTNASRMELMLKMVTFDFRRLRSFSDVLPVQEFIRFVRLLYALGNNTPESINIVRTTTISDTDEQLLMMCASLTEPLSLETGAGVDELEISPRHVLVGFKMKTVLILFTPEVVIMYSMDDFDVVEDSSPLTAGPRGRSQGATEYSWDRPTLSCGVGGGCSPSNQCSCCRRPPPQPLPPRLRKREIDQVDEELADDPEPRPTNVKRTKTLSRV